MPTDIASELEMVKALGSYPYPVVGAGDDVDSKFEVKNVSRQTTAHQILLEFETELDDPDLIKLVASEYVELSVKVRCGSTFQVRHCVPDLMDDFGVRRKWRMTLSQDEFSGRVSFEVLLVARRTLLNYALTRQSGDYGNAVFRIDVGDLVGVSNGFVIDVEKWYDPLRPPLDSCMKFSSDDNLVGRIDVVFANRDYIDVRIPASSFADFASLQHYRKFLLATAVVPSLMHTLSKLDSEEFAAFDDYPWVLSLRALIEKHGVDGRDPFDQVQAILEDPIIAAVTEEAAYVEPEDE